MDVPVLHYAEKLRGVFEALLANSASRALMRNLLQQAGTPFDEAAFEQQVKDPNYFNLAIAPILRRMPAQKLSVLAGLQVCNHILSCLLYCVSCKSSDEASDSSALVQQTQRTYAQGQSMQRVVGPEAVHCLQQVFCQTVNASNCRCTRAAICSL
eukprot:GHRR01031982.1.p1 GENE.GHRR01031982.1~~GHRR01031982.1.p1  ORF type:complete len:155 (+),score=30.11 GHRR01031982.1:317-781(+)